MLISNAEQEQTVLQLPFAVHQANAVLADFQLLRHNFPENIHRDVAVHAHCEGASRQQLEVQSYFLRRVFHLYFFFSLQFPIPIQSIEKHLSGCSTALTRRTLQAGAVILRNGGVTRTLQNTDYLLHKRNEILFVILP